MTSNSHKTKQESLIVEPCASGYLVQAIEALLNLDIPAKGRIAHHIRRGRLQRALALCASGRHQLWQKVWQRSAPAMEQVWLLSQVEALLDSAMKNGKMKAVGGIS